MSERINLLKQRLANSRAFVDAVLNQVGDRWETQVYADGAAWNVRQVVIHLLNAESGMFAAAQRIAEGGEGVPADFDLDRYNKRSVEKRSDLTPDSARAGLAESRAALLAWMDTLTHEQLEKVGRHASLNMFTVEQFIKIISSHEREHAQDIARVLGITV